MSDSIVMTEAEREAFLADVHTGIISIADGERGPLSVPVWYRVDERGDVLVLTPTESRKARLCEVGTRVSLVAQTEDLPPKYVSIEGPITAMETGTVDDATQMAARYLGDEIAAAYVEMTRGAPGVDAKTEVLITIRPERWFSGDFAKRHA